MPRLCFPSDPLEAKHQPRLLGVEAISNIEIEARIAAEPDQAGSVKDEERLHIPEVVPVH